MSDDLKGYYARLGVVPTASDAEIRAAYRNLAKEHHPDAGHAKDDGARFKGISEAYAVLSDTESRAAYDGLSATTSATSAQESRSQIIPICCDSCGKVTAQPRYVVFRHVVSFVLGTVRTPVQGIFCADCARSKALKATALSAVAGWWGVPWGPVWTFAEGFKNAFGGTSDAANNERLLWHNALAFGLQGQNRLSIALADRLRGAKDRQIAANAAKLIDHFNVRGVELGSTTLKDPWARSPAHLLSHFTIITVPPILLAGVIFAAAQQPQSTLTYPPLADVPPSAYGQPAVVGTADPESLPVKIAEVPVCKRQPANGAVLTGKRRLLSSGHLLEINNGSAGDAIVKLRRSETMKTTASFLVRSNESASLSGIPDGEYAIQYAFGPSLSEDCKSFTSIESAGQFPQIERLTTERTEVYDGINIRRMRLSYTLYSVPGGNVRPETIAADAFGTD
jgi:hypothetical protein